MAYLTYEAVWRNLLLLAPDLPVPIAQRAVNAAYRRILGFTRWSGLRGENAFFIPAGESTGTVTVTQGSATVAGSGTAWTSALLGWQFFTGGKAPYYTVIAVDPGGLSLTLDRPWGAATASAQTYGIQLVYLTPAADFLFFTDIRDVVNNWRMVGLTTVEYLDKIDAQRSYAGTSYVLAVVPPASLGAIPRYEIYPRPPIASTASYPYRYEKRIPELSAPSDLPIYPIRAETIQYGALAEISKWPGTAERPNPYFDLNLQALHESAFFESQGQDNRNDQEMNPTDLSYEPVQISYPYFPFSADFMQSHMSFAYGY